MLKIITRVLLGVFVMENAMAHERGAPIFQDAFETKELFAENWVADNYWSERIFSAEGNLHFPHGGHLQMRRDTPGDFYAEMDITVNGLTESATRDGFCGFMIEGFRFTVNNKGGYWLASAPDGAGGTGLRGTIDGFQLGEPVRVSLIRRVEHGVAHYTFRVNGKEAVTRAHPLHEPPDGKFKPLEIFSYNIDMSIDNFGLFMVSDPDSSPNLIINSGFEYELDGFPPYYMTLHPDLPHRFFPLGMAEIPYEGYLATVSLDDQEKHSGKYSLRVVNDRSSVDRGYIRPWGVGTVAGAAGVFSAWMKADREDLPVSIGYGGRPITVQIGREWKRYEVVNTNLPKPGVYSPVSVSFTAEGTLWIDDLQAEFIRAPTEEELESGKTFASPYQPSDLDKDRFGQKEKTVSQRVPEITVPKLPDGVRLGERLDSWKQYATKVDVFYYGERLPANKTEAYLASDETNLYIGARCYVDDLEKIEPKDDFFEINVDPIVSGKPLRQLQFITYADGRRRDLGRGLDSSWSGEWTSSIELNEETSSIDYTITIPFANLAHPELKASWIMNLHRYDSVTKEIITLIQSSKAPFRNPQLWPYVHFPEEIVKPHVLGTAGGVYSESAVTLELDNFTGKERKVTVGLVAEEIIREREVTLAPGANSVSFPLQLNDPKVAIKMMENGIPVANQVVTLERRDPVSMLGRLSFYMNEEEAPFRITTSVADPQQLTAVLTCGEVSVKQPAAARFQIALPLRDIAEGAHDVTLTLINEEGDTVARASGEVIKRPFRDGAAQVNHFSRSLMHNGKPVVPYAPFFVILGRWGRTEKNVDTCIAVLERYGFEYTHVLFQSHVNMEKENALLRHFLDETNKRGIKVILWSNYYRYDSDEDIAETIQALDFPNVIAQMVLDEPELSRTSDWSRDFLRKMHPLFPYQPTFMNNTVLGIPARHANLETDILMIDDYLTNHEGRTVLSVVQHADVMREAGAAEGKPGWYFLVGNNTTLHYREPTYSEQIAQVYGTVAAGVTGFSIYHGWPGTPGNWRAHLQLKREIKALTDVLTSEKETAQAVSTGDSDLLRQITKKHNGHLYVIACNIDEHPAGSIEFSLPAEYRYAEEAEVMFEDRQVQVSNGRFSDVFDGHARHVYRIKIKP